MNLEFLGPGLAALGLAVALSLGLARWHLPPRMAVRALSVVAGVAAGTVGLVVAATAAGFVLGPARRADLVETCRVVPLHHEIGLVQGVGSLVALTVMAARICLVIHRRRVAARGTEGRRLSILDTDEPMAFAAPGRPGCVVVSTGLLSALEPKERQVVFAHERAHLRQGHHRYLLLGAISVAVLPILRPLVARLRHATELCADEEAVATLNGDRHLVATAIAKAALIRTSFHDAVPAFSGGSVVTRVNALIGTPASTWSTRVGFAATVLATLSVIGAGSIQLQHLWVVVDHICTG